MTCPERSVARGMVASARPQEFGALVALMRAARSLGQADSARWAARRAFLCFGPADQLVLERKTRITQISPEQIAEITEVLRTARGRGVIGPAFNELRQADARYCGRTVATRMQAIAYLMRRSRGKAAARLTGELQRWQPAVSLTLKSGSNDRWIPASFNARNRGRGLGRLVASALLAHRP